MDEMRERIVAAAKRTPQPLCGVFTRAHRHAFSEPARGRHRGAGAQEMLRMGYQNAEIERFGNVVGRVGDYRLHYFYAHLDNGSIGDRSLEHAN